MFDQNKKKCKNLFVYGTLTQNRVKNSYVIINKMLQYLENGKIKGKLYDLGEYPGAIENKEGYIYGEIYRINDPKVLDNIDEYEGYYPNKLQESLYIRKITTAILKGGKEIPVFVYFYNKDIHNANEIPSGKWKDIGKRGD